MRQRAADDPVQRFVLSPIPASGHSPIDRLPRGAKGAIKPAGYANGKGWTKNRIPGKAFCLSPGFLNDMAYAFFFDVTARRINSIPTVNATPKAKQIRAFWIRPARIKQTKLIAATVIA